MRLFSGRSLGCAAGAPGSGGLGAYAVHSALDCFAGPRYGLTGGLDRRLAGCAVGLDHLAGRVTALTLGVRQLVQKLAGQVQGATLRVGDGANGGGVKAADVTWSGCQLAG